MKATPIKPAKFYTTEEASELLATIGTKLKPRQLRNLCLSGEVKHRKVPRLRGGYRWEIKGSELKKILASRQGPDLELVRRKLAKGETLSEISRQIGYPRSSVAYLLQAEKSRPKKAS